MKFKVEDFAVGAIVKVQHDEDDEMDYDWGTVRDIDSINKLIEVEWDTVDGRTGWTRISNVVEISDSKISPEPIEPAKLTIERREVFVVAGKEFHSKEEAEKYFCELWFENEAALLLEKHNISKNYTTAEGLYELMIDKPLTVIGFLNRYDIALVRMGKQRNEP